MKILFIGPRIHTNQFNIIKTLKEKGHKVFFHAKFKYKIEDHSYVRPKIFKESIVSKIIKFFFGTWGMPKIQDLPNFKIYYKEVKKILPDIAIIRVHGFFYTYFIALIMKILKINIIFYDQKDFYKHYLRLNIISLIKTAEFFLRLKLFKAIWITPINNNKKKLPNKCFYLPFAVSIIKKNKKITSKKILVVAKPKTEHNYFLALNVLKRISKKFDVTMTIVSQVFNSSHKKIKKEALNYVKKNGLMNHIKFLENIPYSKMENIYKKNSIFLHPADFNIAPVSICEALGYGLPVICSDACGTKCYVKNGYNGYIFKKNDTQSLFNIINKIFVSVKFHNQLSRNAVKDAKKNISSENYYKKFKFIIKKQFNLIV